MQIEVLGDRYQLQEPIGRGGMATIYRGRDRRMDRVVAIKVLRDIYSTDTKFVTRFQREAKAASALQHPNIVQVYDYGQTDGNYFIVMELVEGTDLRRYLRSRINQHGVLDTERAIIIAHDVALGLGAAHRRGIVHRDVKPQNILVGRDGSIKLTDFGIASVYKDINAERLTTTGMTLGTVQYYAPEQAQGEIVFPAADVYALGIVMYEMLTGHTPFDGDTPVAVAMQHIQDPPVPPSQYNPAIPPALEEIILRCLEKVPEMRFRDGSELARALETLGDPDAMSTLPLTPGSTPVPSTSPANQIPSRPITSGRGPARPNPNAIPPRVPMSSPNNMMPNGVPPDSMNGNGHGPGTFSPTPQPMYPDQNVYLPPVSPPGSETTRPFRREGGPNDRKGSRTATTVTILILFATLLLLGFSIYLANQLGFIKLPFLNNGVGTPTATVSVMTPVPKLIGKDYATALSIAQSAGFKLIVKGYTSPDTPPASYVVTQQSPEWTAKARMGSTIEVTMGPKTTTVPNIPVGTTLAAAELTLQNAGLNVKIVDAGPNSKYGPNTVVRVQPAPGASIDVNGTVTLDVANYTAGTPGVTPTTSPSPTPTKTPDPSPSPTTTPDPTPTSTPDPTPTTTPTPTITPTPTGTAGH